MVPKTLPFMCPGLTTLFSSHHLLTLKVHRLLRSFTISWWTNIKYVRLFLHFPAGNSFHLSINLSVLICGEYAHSCTRWNSIPLSKYINFKFSIHRYFSCLICVAVMNNAFWLNWNIHYVILVLVCRINAGTSKSRAYAFTVFIDIAQLPSNW